MFASRIWDLSVFVFYFAFPSYSVFFNIINIDLKAQNLPRSSLEPLKSSVRKNAAFTAFRGSGTGGEL